MKAINRLSRNMAGALKEAFKKDYSAAKGNIKAIYFGANPDGKEIKNYKIILAS